MIVKYLILGRRKDLMCTSVLKVIERMTKKYQIGPTYIDRYVLLGGNKLTVTLNEA